MLLGLQVHQDLDGVDQLGIGAVVGAAHLGDGGIDLRGLADHAAQQPRLVARLVDRDRCRQVEADPHRAFVQLGQELAAEELAHAHGHHQQAQRRTHHQLLMVQRPGQHRLIEPLAVAHDEVVVVRDVPGEQQVAQQRHQRQREDQGADQRARHRVGHRREDLALVPLQREDRDVRRNDDDHREHGRTAHFRGGLQDGMQARLAVLDLLRLELAQPLEDILNHDHRAVDDDTEVHRAKRQQVGWNTHPGQPDEGRQQRQRDDQRHDRRGAHVGQEQVQHRHHQQRAFHQVAEHGVQGLVDQRGAIVVRHDLHALGQDLVVQQVDPLLQRLQHQRRVLALAHHHDARDDVVLVVLAHQALRRRAADPHVGDILDKDGGAVVLGHHHVGDIGRGTEAAQRAQQELLPAVRHGAAAGVGIGALQRGEQLRQ